MSDGYVCPECGLDYDTIAPGDAVVAVRSFPRRYREAFDDVEDDALHARPDPKTWSAVEYTAHVGDVFDAFAEIFRRWRAGNHDFEGLLWDQDKRAEENRYNERSAEDVLGALEKAAKALADSLEKIESEQWSSMAPFPWGERDMLTMARNGVHEGSHHLRDITKGLGRD